MGKVSHTPGPWLLDGNVIYALDETKTTNRFSAQVQGGYVRRDTRGRGNDVRTPYPEIAANFRVMRAAPEMLEALIDARRELEEYELERSGEAYNNPALNAAIAKATGEAE